MFISKLRKIIRFTAFWSLLLTGIWYVIQYAGFYGTSSQWGVFVTYLFKEGYEVPVILIVVIGGFKLALEFVPIIWDALINGGAYMKDSVSERFDTAKLIKLHELRQKGIYTEEEYQTAITAIKNKAPK